MEITPAEIYKALGNTAELWKKRPSLRDMAMNAEATAATVADDILSGRYLQKLSYRDKEITNVNGKTRRLHIPDDYTLVIEHVAREKMQEIYAANDPMVGLNCKIGCGIQSKWRRGSVHARVKHIVYERRDLNYVLLIDQRKCYDHIRPGVFARALRYLGAEKDVTDFCTKVSFVDGRLPIGAPCSPLVHHIIMLRCDRLCASMSPLTVRYADNLLLPFATKEEAHAAKWRIKNLWWYELGIRAKRHDCHIAAISAEGFDFCGTVYRRNEGRSVTDHDKGYTQLRSSSARRIRCKADRKSWPSYFGMLKSVDGFGLATKLEQTMPNLKQLTDKIRINRSLDAPNIQVKDLAEAGIVFAVHDYEIRADGRGNDNWIKCLISYPSPEANGRRVMREFHGNYGGIIAFHRACEAAIGKEAMLPMTSMVIINSCGYIYEGSTNMLTEIDDADELND